MIYKGYVLEHSEVYDVKSGWHRYGVILNVLEKDFDCTGDSLEELKNNFEKLVDDNFDELQNLTCDFEVDLDSELIQNVKNLDDYSDMSTEEMLTRFLINLAKDIENE